MATRVKTKKLSIEKAFKNVKPVSYTDNKIIGELLRTQDSNAIVARYMGAIKPKRKRKTAK